MAKLITLNNGHVMFESAFHDKVSTIVDSFTANGMIVKSTNYTNNSDVTFEVSEYNEMGIRKAMDNHRYHSKVEGNTVHLNLL